MNTRNLKIITGLLFLIVVHACKDNKTETLVLQTEIGEKKRPKYLL